MILILKKYKYLFFLSAYFFASCTGKKLISYPVLQTQPYCGGAKPSMDMEERSRVPLPYANKTLIFISNKNKIDSVKTNEVGVFSVKLPNGIFHFYESWKYYKDLPNDEYGISSYDKSCLEVEYKKPDLIITISGNNYKTEDNLKNPKCPWQHPCLTERRIPQ